jgi:uncharacterized membrane protein YfcA
MTAALALTVVLAAGIGVSLGLLGGGGSILAVPLLVYVSGLPPKEAIATSLLVVGVTSAAGAVPHARAGRVRWRTGLLFGLAGMAGAYAGGRLAAFIPATVLLVGFGLLTLVTAIAMIRGRRGTDGGHVVPELRLCRIITDGLMVGLVTGMVGAGGGFLVVPALALLGGLPMPVAVGTSLLVIAMKSFGGLAGFLATVDIHWGLAAVVAVAAIAGSLTGSRLAGRLPGDRLRRAFGWFVAVVGTAMLAQQLASVLGSGVLLWTVVGVSAGAAAMALHHRRGRSPDLDHATAGVGSNDRGTPAPGRESVR